MKLIKLFRWLWLGLLLAPLQAGAVTYAMTTITSNWIDSSTHTKITANSTPYKFVGGGGCGTASPTIDDVISDSIPIGFNFTFGGVSFGALRVMSNGRVQFGNATCGFGTQNVGPPQTFYSPYPDASLTYTMRIYGGDLDATIRRGAGSDPGDSVANYPSTCTNRNSCYISYAMTGTAPNRSFIVTWNNVPEWVNFTQTAGNFNLQIILQENGEFIYQFGATNYASTGRAQIGWEVDTQDYEASAVGLPPSGTAFKYFIPRPVAEYRMEQPSWTGATGEILDTTGNARNATRVGAPVTVPNAPGYICRGASFPANSNAATIDAVATPINVSTEIGSTGTITFWYKPTSTTTWGGGSAVPAMLFDATTASGQYFYLVKEMNGANPRLRFAITDSLNNVRVVTATAPALDTLTNAIHIAVDWSFNPLAAANSDFMRIYVNGVKAAELPITTTAGISNSLGTLHVGDNRSAFVQSAAYGGSANGVIDEFRMYTNVWGLGLILRDKNLPNACLDHYAIQHAGLGFTCNANPVTVLSHTGPHSVYTNNGKISLNTTTGLGDWTLISGYGTLINGTANDGQATYSFNNEYQAVFGLTHTVAGTVNINVSDGQIVEQASEDPNLVLSSCGTAALNACEKTTPQCVPQKPATNLYDHLFTKLADTAFDLDFVAQKTDGTLDTGFNGLVSVSLLANLSTANVNTSTNCPTAASTATISLGNVTFASGRATKTVAANAFSSVTPNYSAYKDVRVNFICTLANCGQDMNVCSTDNFSVRPQALNVAVTKSDGVSPLNNASFTTGTPSLLAGTDFLILATGVPGYNGVPTIKRTVADQTVVSHLSTTDYVGNLRDASGINTITLGSATVATGLSTGTVQYHDYGQFRLKAGAVRDSVFAAADRTNGDCVADSVSNAAISGKFGCDVGNQSDTALFGRFYPSYFAATGTLTPACLTVTTLPPTCTASNYFGQNFVLTYSVSAKSFPNPQLADSVTMTRYSSSNVVSVGLYDGTGATDLSGNITPAPGVGAWTSGIFAPTETNDSYTRNVTTPGAPVDNGYVVIRAVDPDGATIGRATAAQTTVSDNDFKTGTPACTSGCTHKKLTLPSNCTVTSFRYGRLWLGNAYGSERSVLNLPYESQYWNGKAFVKNTLDTCTTLTTANVGIGNYQNSVTAANLPAGAISLVTLPSGQSAIRLAAPNPNAAGSVDVVVRLNSAVGMCPVWAPSPVYPAGTPTSLDHLRGKWCGTNFSKDPVARATFGIYSNSRQIFLREGI